MPAGKVTRANDGVSRRLASAARATLTWLGAHRLAVIVFAIAFLLRFVYLLAYSRAPLFGVPIADALYHQDWAKRILDGDLFSLKMPGVLYKAPLYPYLIALVYWLFGQRVFVLMLLQVLLAAGSCLLLFVIGKRYVGAAAGFVGALLYACYFPSIYFSAEMEIPTVAIFFTLLSFYLLLSHRPVIRALSALVLGLSLLALPTNLLLLPLYLTLLFSSADGTRAGLKRAALYAVLTLATLAPCTARNLIAGHHPTLISANGGLNFYLGNNAHYDDTVYLQPGYAFEELYDEPRRLAGVDATADRDRYWYRKAFAFIAAQPGKAAALALKKVVLYFADYEIYRNTDSYDAKARSLYRNVPFVPASVLLSFGLLGLLWAWRQGKGTPLAMLCALLALPCVIFFVTDRYRLPSMGVWAVFSGFFVTSVAKLVRARAWPRTMVALAGAGALVVVSNLNLFVVKNPAYRPHLNRGFAYETRQQYDRALQEYATALALLQRTLPRAHKLASELKSRIGNVHMLANDLPAARKSFEQALAADPASAPAYSYLGSLDDKEKQFDRAITRYDRALALNPWDVVSLYNLGLVYLNQHRLDEATRQFKRVLELAPEHASAHNNLAFIFGTQGKLDQMETEVKHAIHFDPRSSSARYNLASLYFNSGRTEEAIAEYQTIARLMPSESSNAYNQLGIIDAQKNDLPRAIANWQRALAVDPKNQDATANLERAQRLLREGKP